MSRLDELKAQLAQLDVLIRRGVLTGEAAIQARARLEAEVLAAVLRPAAEAAKPAAPPSRRLVLGVAAFVLAFGIAGYAWQGNRAGMALEPGAMVAAPADAGSAVPATSQAQIEAMVERLAERLKTQPEDAAGWTMLGRSYNVLARYPQALQAYRHVLELRPNEAQAHADVADALGMANGRKLDGEPEPLIARALQLDPDNGKALALAGTAAFDRGDAALAARHWAHALKQAEPGSDTARQLQGALDEARQAVGLTSASAPASAAGRGGAVAEAKPTAAAAASVQARITLAPAVVAQAAPGDTVFIFARAVAGPKAPLAIQRRQVKDLPLSLTLDDSMAMSPALRISSVAQVVIGARVSKSGNALAQPGDLQGLSRAVAVGARDVTVEIADVLR